MWKNKYDLNGGSLFRYINRFDYIKSEADTSIYEIVFDYEDERYYCFVRAFNSYEAMGIFFKEHASISFDNIVDTDEV